MWRPVDPGMRSRPRASAPNSSIEASAGDTTAGLLSRFHPEVIAPQPHAVILMGGANDLWWDLDLGPIQANLFAMVCQARSHRIVPVLGLPPPIDVGRARTHDMFQPRAGWEVCSRKLAQLVISLRAAAGACAVACLDFHRLFLTPGGYGAQRALPR